VIHWERDPGDKEILTDELINQVTTQAGISVVQAKK